MTAPLPLDARACWLLDTLRRLYQELDPDAVPIGVSIQAASGGQIISYGVNTFGGDEVIRLVTDMDGLAVLDDAIRGSLAGAVTDATVRDGPT